MNNSNDPIVRGDVVPRLHDLLRLASYRWHCTVTVDMVARGTGLNPKTVRALAADDPKKQPVSYGLRTVALLCWYLGCSSKALLHWQRAPEGSGTAWREPTLSRSAPPSTPPPPGLSVRDTIIPRLTGRERAEISRHTGLSYQGVTDLLNPAAPHRRIKRTTLAALCSYLSETDRPTEPGDLLTYEPQEPPIV